MRKFEITEREANLLAAQYGSDRSLNNKAVLKMLKLHSLIGYEEGGKVYAIEYYTSRNGRNYEETVDLTGISRLELLAWLGY